MSRASFLILSVLVFCGAAYIRTNVDAHNNDVAVKKAGPVNFVRVSTLNPAYLELDNGALFIPVGINICWPRFVSSEDSVMNKMEYYLDQLGKNGGNFTRIWLSAPAFEVEHEKAGSYDETIARRIDRLVAIAKRNGIRIKFCLENFRALTNLPPMFAGSVPFDKPIYDKSGGGGLSSMKDFFTTARGKDLYLKRVEFLAKRYADEPTVFGWELWNEMNSVRIEDKKILEDWTSEMLGEVKRRVPKQLVMQSLGSYDTETATEWYRNYSVMPGNQIAQVHRYLDPGAKLEVSKGAMDKLAYDAVRTLKDWDLKKPVLLSEVGAVQAHHAGPSELYPKDSAGMMLHDYLYAAFFAGAAGPGQSWHWDYYIDKHHLWYQLARFNKAIRGLDPRTEDFKPFVKEENGLTVYGLQGKKTVLLWCRDQANTWEKELGQGIKPTRLSGLSVTLPFKVKVAKVSFYDPWKDKEMVLKNGNTIALPDFQRSGIVRLSVKH
ncbi:cellulase family glycosylhydrolase [Dyadobacter sp. CY323]|uniref:cellulase family glycosylhydrolase n=1 Tax=Dyadobacter sp. CY323 TaxID=2907302 RepID=UPI001F457243|nr:cellulase family glycosylhydrolase [Dyadobacter sp. CY323]MCE6991268.1 cellulase family glycosylhydrolase [Dyadobacter sp. CY323]